MVIEKTLFLFLKKKKTCAKRKNKKEGIKKWI
jgi:hypothetical protein